jgi:hypothetical protein
MKRFFCALILLVMITQLGQTRPNETPSTKTGGYDTVLTRSLDGIISHSDTLKDQDDLVIEDAHGFDSKSNRQEALKRIAALPKLTVLRFLHSDLSKLDENDPVPPTVKCVDIEGGPISPSTLRWLAKFPPGDQLQLGVCDLRGLDLTGLKFNTLSIGSCQLLRGAIVPLVEKTWKVEFKECELFDEKP